MRLIPVKAPAVAGLVIVIVTVLFCPATIGLVPNDFETLTVVTLTLAFAGDGFLPPSVVVNALAGIVLVYGPAAGTFASVVTWAVIVQDPAAGSVPFARFTVLVGAPDNVAVAPSLPVVQVVEGVPVNRKLLFGVVGRVSDRVAPVKGLDEGFVIVIVNVLVEPAANVEGENAFEMPSPETSRSALAGVALEFP